MFRITSTTAIILLLAAAGCASDPSPPQNEDQSVGSITEQSSPISQEQSYGVIIAESWDQKVELASEGFLRRVGSTGKKFAKYGAAGGAATGCVSGAIAVAAVAPSSGALEVGCVAGSVALGMPFFVLGYGIGALAGAVEGTASAAVKGAKMVAGDKEDSIDTAPLLAAFKKTDPPGALRFALDEAAEDRYPILNYTFVTKKLAIEDKPLAFIDRVSKRIKLTDEDALKIGDAGSSHILALLIHRFDVTTTGMVAPVSRLNVQVSGELRTTEDNKRLNTWLWEYQSKPVKPQTLAAENAKLLHFEILEAWDFIVGKIISDVWG